MVVLENRGRTSTGKASGSDSQSVPDPLSSFPEDVMAGKRTASKAKRKALKSSAWPSQAASILAVATNNLVNMVAVTTVSGAVLHLRDGAKSYLIGGRDYVQSSWRLIWIRRHRVRALPDSPALSIPIA